MKSKLVDTALASIALLSVSAFASKITEVGSFDTPVGEMMAGPAHPGESFTFTVTVNPDERLHLASMYGASNDWFFGVEGDGINVQQYQRASRSGAFNITGAIGLYDAGTEVDENLSAARYNGPNQLKPNTGLADPVAYVRGLCDFASFEVGNFIDVTVTPTMRTSQYQVTINVLSHSPTGISPGVFWVAKTGAGSPFAIFEKNKAPRMNGLEALAEDGNHLPLMSYLQMKAQQ